MKTKKQIINEIEEALNEFGLENINNSTVVTIDKETEEVTVFNSDFNTFTNSFAVPADSLFEEGELSSELIANWLPGLNK